MLWGRLNLWYRGIAVWSGHTPIVLRDELLQMRCRTMRTRGPHGFFSFAFLMKNIVDAQWPAGSFKAILSRLIGAVACQQSHSYRIDGRNADFHFRIYACFNRIEDLRRVSTQYDKLADSNLVLASLVCASGQVVM